MLILSIDTSTKYESVALLEDENLKAEYCIYCPSSHSESLLSLINRVLLDKKLDIKDIDGICVSLGPGSFTGLRIGLSVAKGLAFGLKRPLVGISTLEALALQVPATDPIKISPMLDARKSEVYTALFQAKSCCEIKRLANDMVISPKSWLENLKGKKTIFVGDGAFLYRDLIEEILGENAFIASPIFSIPHASTVGLIGLKRLKNNDVDDINLLTPLYTRPPDAEVSKRKGSFEPIVSNPCF